MKYYLVGHPVFMYNPRELAGVLHVFLIFKFIANTELNEVPYNHSQINKYPSFPIPWRILNDDRFEMSKTSG